MTDDPKLVETTLQHLSDKLQETLPEMATVIQQYRAGEISERQAMAALLEIANSTPGAEEQIIALSHDALAPLRQTETPDATFTPRAGKGQTTVNPLFAAAMVERRQFDSDIPELRTSMLPPGAMPAVPVKTKVRDPVALGMMLETASKKTFKQLDAQAKTRKANVQALLANPDLIRKQGALLAHNSDTLLALEANKTMQMLQGTKEDDPDHYRRGEIAKPLKVQRPRGSVLATMSEAQRHEMAWRFLSTSQGRRSAVEAIRDQIAVYLGTHGIAVEEREANPKDLPIAYSTWSVTIAGPGATQPAFALLDVAAKSLARGLQQDLQATAEMFYLEVLPIDQVDERVVGWAARLCNVCGHS